MSNDKKPASPVKQSELRADGLLARPADRWTSPEGDFYLSALPRAFKANRRQRSDRLTPFEVDKIGKPAKSKEIKR